MDRSRSLALGGTGRRPLNGESAPRREVVLAGAGVGYRIVRVRRQSIGMLIDHDGLTVRAPRWVSIADIEQALREKGEWIVRKLADWRERASRMPRHEWRHGAPVLYRGRLLELAVFRSRQRSVLADLFHLRVTHPQPIETGDIESIVLTWLKDQARGELEPKVRYYAARLGRDPTEVRLSNARTQWGSCNPRREIRLNWRLIQLPPHLADYVAAHEASHLVELNHSARFWNVVGSLYPDYQEARRQLEEFVPLLDS